MLDFDKLQKEHGPKLLQKAMTKCHGNFTFAEEAVQETFVAAWKYRESFDGGNVGGWLHTILANKIIDAFRHKRSKSFLHLSIQHDDGGEVKEGFKKLMVEDPEPETKTVFQLVEKIIESLPEDSAPILKMRLLDGMQQKDIAAKLGIPLGTVMSRGFRVMKTLREELSKQMTEASCE